MRERDVAGSKRSHLPDAIKGPQCVKDSCCITLNEATALRRCALQGNETLARSVLDVEHRCHSVTRLGAVPTDRKRAYSWCVYC